MIALVLALAFAGADAAEAKARFVEGQAAYETGHFEDALASFEAAYRADPLPGFLFNLGQCHNQLAHYDKAAFFYQSYLEKVPDAENKSDVVELLNEVNAKLAASSAPAPPPPPPPPAAPEDNSGWIWAGASVGVGALVVGAVAIYLVTRPSPPAATLGTLDRSHT